MVVISKRTADPLWAEATSFKPKDHNWSQLPYREAHGDLSPPLFLYEVAYILSPASSLSKGR